MTIHNNMKNINKTILFASLIAAMILPFSVMSMAEAAPNENASDTVADKIPYDKLMDRTYDKWNNQYQSIDEFNKVEFNVRAYVNADQQQNGWNQAMVKEMKRVYNFDTIIGKSGYGHEIVSLFVAKEKTLGTYDVSDAVSKYHDWASLQYDIPTTLVEIDARILEIIEDTKFMHLAEQVVESYNNRAEHGSVLPELILQDSGFWTKQRELTLCSYLEYCDVEKLRLLIVTEPTAKEQEELIIFFNEHIRNLKQFAFNIKAAVDLVKLDN